MTNSEYIKQLIKDNINSQGPDWYSRFLSGGSGITIEIDSLPMALKALQRAAHYNGYSTRISGDLLYLFKPC